MMTESELDHELVILILGERATAGELVQHIVDGGTVKVASPATHARRRRALHAEDRQPVAAVHSNQKLYISVEVIN